MPTTSSAMSIHLRYRLWIAELNFDINILRIFGDYLAELRTRRKESDVKAKTDYFEQVFNGFRTEIDEILTLRILTLTDEERRQAAAADPRVEAMLVRTESLAREQLMNLHGTTRGLRPLCTEERHA